MRTANHMGEQIPGLGLGSWIDAVHDHQPGLGDATIDKSALDAAVTIGDTSFGSANYPAAVVAYQSAGITGQQLGQELDTQTGGVSQSYTSQATGLNTQLQQIVASAAGLPEAQRAHDLAHQMQTLYAQAATVSPAPPVLSPVPVPVTTPTTTTSTASTTTPANHDVLIAAAGIAVVAGAWWWYRNKRK